MSDIQLNPSQKKAVEHKKGPLLIIAGAGTGKTRVITQRILWLIEKKLAKPDEILALTFTNKAAREMEERVDVIMPYGYEQMWISTFHSFCDSILRQEAIYIGLDPSYVLMSQAQEYVFFRSNLFEFKLDRLRPHGNPTRFIHEILKHFSRLSDEDVSPDEYEDFIKKSRKLDAEYKKDLKELSVVYREYAELKEKESRLGFADLVPLTLKLFRERPEVLKRYQKQFKYILVDEFQDTNYAQNELVMILAGKDKNITVVGDDDQSIYKFRGAAISNILDFKKTFPDCTTVVLVKNYRSNQGILDTAYTLVRHNDPYRLEVTEKIDKKLVSADFVSGMELPKKLSGLNSEELKDQMRMNDGNGSVLEDEMKQRAGSKEEETVRRIHEVNDVAESEAVAKEISFLTSKEKFSYSDIAILVRAHAHADEFVQSLRFNEIPYRFLGSRGLYTRPEIKDLIAFLRVLVDYKDDVSLYRLLTLDTGKVTPREFIDLQRLAKKNKSSLFELLEELFEKPVGKTSKKSVKKRKSAKKLQSSAPERKLDVDLQNLLSKNARGWIEQLLDIYDDSFKQVHDGKSVGSVLYDFIEKSGYVKDLLAEESQENEWKIQNIGAYFEMLKRFEKEHTDVGVSQYMEYLDYSMEIGENPQVDQGQIAEFDGVNISTIHGAKGLEFPVVFLVNLVNERFPTRRRTEVLPIPDGLIKEELPEGDEHIQEERRLCYVGVTRAEKLLYLTSADYYAQGIRKKKQSVFLHDIGMVEEPVDQKEKPELAISKRSVLGDEMEISIPGDISENFLKKVQKNLSYSYISSFETCPFQFRFKYILGIPGISSPGRSFGLTVHNTLREFYERLMRSKQGFENFEKPPDLKDLLEIYDEKWQSEGYETKTQENRRYNSGKKALTNYYETFYSEKENPIWLEGRFKVDLDGIRLNGVVDRLDESKDGLEIIDYKTGRLPRDEREVEKNLQLPIYVIAVEQLRDKPVKKAGLLFVEHGKKFSIEVSKEMKDNSVKQIKETLNEIKKMKFPPKPGRLCKFCDYRNICDYAMMD